MEIIITLIILSLTKMFTYNQTINGILFLTISFMLIADIFRIIKIKNKELSYIYLLIASFILGIILVLKRLYLLTSNNYEYLFLLYIAIGFTIVYILFLKNYSKNKVKILYIIGLLSYFVGFLLKYLFSSLNTYLISSIFIIAITILISPLKMIYNKNK